MRVWGIKDNGWVIEKKRSVQILEIRGGKNTWSDCKTKKPLRFERLSRCWRDSNSRPPAWQAGILTKLNYSTCFFYFFVTFCVIDYECKDTTFFHICKHFFKKNSLFLKLFFILLIINKIFLIKLFYKKYSFFSYIMIFYA